MAKTKPRVLSKEETDKIRQQFGDYRADSERQDRHTNVSSERKEKLVYTETDGQHARDHLRDREPPMDATSGSDSDSSTDDDEVNEMRRSASRSGASVSTFTSANLLNRSKTIASTGINSRGPREINRRSATYLDANIGSSSNSNGNSGATYNGGAQSTKDTTLRHHSSSGSLRSVARLGDQRRSVTLRSERKDDSRVVGDMKEEVSDKQELPLAGITTNSKESVPPPSSQPLSQQEQPSHRDLPHSSVTLSHPPAAYKVPTESPASIAMGLLPIATSKTIVDEEGGDWGLQAQPRRYNSVKLGMTGVTGVTRRAIGRPIERGHGVERGPEDCV
ncbi:hypothetical protein BGZ80_007213 [Entomortierella chlamydospora]|uniref:Uncharacterized protein n=1 Tax=Entomortierella chlamydospora TaxID=101097 RepID=A0A9P6MEZ2_9FUNG|nr:hypothetical protein BGZ80_007213 [Entomortierella chlamydospora]